MQIQDNEFRLLRDYLEKQCGIRVGEEKRYLFETRLTALMVENGCASFTDLHTKTLADKTNALRDKIVDAMTTNETLWFRDSKPFAVFSSLITREFVTKLAGRPLRIWSAACSTGQEPYSIAMSILELQRSNGLLNPSQVEIIASDISPTVLFLAKAARYDAMAIGRGLPIDLRDRYFSPNGKVWALNEQVKRMVQFRRFNLAESFAGMGTFHLVFCRNVLIYFSDDFKREILNKFRHVLVGGGYLFLGASESIINYTTQYRMLRDGNSLYYQTKEG